MDFDRAHPLLAIPHLLLMMSQEEWWLFIPHHLLSRCIK